MNKIQIATIIIGTLAILLSVASFVVQFVRG